MSNTDTSRRPAPLPTPDATRTCWSHQPIVAGTWSDPTNDDEGEQLVIAHARCCHCQGRIVQVQRRTQPADPQDPWPLGDLLASTPWQLAP